VDFFAASPKLKPPKPVARAGAEDTGVVVPGVPNENNGLLAVSPEGVAAGVVVVDGVAAVAPNPNGDGFEASPAFTVPKGFEAPPPPKALPEPNGEDVPVDAPAPPNPAKGDGVGAFVDGVAVAGVVLNVLSAALTPNGFEVPVADCVAADVDDAGVVVDVAAGVLRANGFEVPNAEVDDVGVPKLNFGVDVAPLVAGVVVVVAPPLCATGALKLKGEVLAAGFDSILPSAPLNDDEDVAAGAGVVAGVVLAALFVNPKLNLGAVVVGAGVGCEVVV